MSAEAVEKRASQKSLIPGRSAGSQVLAAEYGEKVKEGLLEKMSPSMFKSWQKRAFRLQQYAILYSAAKTWNPKDKQCIPLKHITAITLDKALFDITTTQKGKPYKLRASSADEAKEWVDAIQLAMEQCPESANNIVETEESMFDVMKGDAFAAADVAGDAALVGVEAARVRAAQAQEGKKLLDEGGDEVAGVVLAKKTAHDAIVNDKKMLANLQSLLAILADASRQCKEPLEGEEDFKPFAEQYDKRLAAAQKSSEALGKASPAPPPMSGAEHDAADILWLSGQYEYATEMTADGYEVLKKKADEMEEAAPEMMEKAKAAGAGAVKAAKEKGKALAKGKAKAKGKK